MKRFIALAMAALMGVFAFTGCNQSGNGENNSDESWTKVEKAGKLVLGLDDSFPPMGYRDEKTGEIVGFDIDLAKEVCKRLNIELVTQPIDWNSKEFELSSGNIDCIWNGFTYTEDRNEQMNLTAPYMKNTQVIMVSEKSNFKSRADLAGKVLAAQTGSSGENALNDSGDFVKSVGSIVTQSSYLNLLLELENGTVDAVVLDEKVATNYMKKHEGKYRLIQADGKDDYLTEEEYVIGFRKNDIALTDKIVETLKAMAADGAMAKISTEWFGEDVTTIK